MAWMLLVTAGLLKVIWATAMKESEEFTRLWPSVVGVTVSLASFLVLALALKDLPLGTAYAVWGIASTPSRLGTAAVRSPKAIP